MKKSKPWVLTVLILGIVALVIAAFFYNRYATHPNLQLTKFEVVTLDNNPISLSEFQGKPMVVNVWAAWCGTCLKELPAFEEAAKEMGEKVSFVMISDDTIEKNKTYQNKYPNGLQFLHSTQKLKSYNIYTIPVTYFYNREGVLIKKVSGLLTYQDILNNIKEIE